jgi:DNA-binding transcriptional ArsR family regulator
MPTSSRSTGSPPSRTGKRKATAQTAAERRGAQAQKAAALLKQIGDPTRLQVLLLLDDGERNVGALCQDLSLTQPALSHHLALLRHGGIIRPRREGKSNYYSLSELGQHLVRVARALVR